MLLDAAWRLQTRWDVPDAAAVLPRVGSRVLPFWRRRCCCSQEKALGLLVVRGMFSFVNPPEYR